MTITDHQIRVIAAELRFPYGTVALIAQAIDRHTAPRPGIVHKGGGYYLLPDGTTVRGRARAEVAVK